MFLQLWFEAWIKKLFFLTLAWLCSSVRKMQLFFEGKVNIGVVNVNNLMLNKSLIYLLPSNNI